MAPRTRKSTAPTPDEPSSDVREDAQDATQSDAQPDSAHGDAPTAVELAASSDAPPNVHVCIADAMRRVRAVGKLGQNKEQGYAFKRIDDFMTAANEALAAAGVHQTPKVLTRITDETHTTSGNKVMRWVDLEVRFRFYGPAGDHVDAIVWGEGRDAADKATNKALTAAQKYALMYVLMIPTDDIQDGDRESPEATRGAPISDVEQQRLEREHAERVERERQAAREQRARDMQIATADAETVEQLRADVLSYADEISDPLARKEQLIAVWNDATRAGALGCEVRVPDAWAAATGGPELCLLHQLISGAADVNLPQSGELNMGVDDSAVDPSGDETVDPWATDGGRVAEGAQS